MKNTFLFLSALAVLAPSASAGASDEPETIRVLLLRMEALNDNETQADALAKRLVELIDARAGFEATTRDEVRQLIVQQAAADPECSGEKCMEAAVEASKAKYILIGSLGVVAGERVVSLTSIDTEVMRPVGGASAAFKSDEEVLEHAEALVGQTFHWSDAPALPRATFTMPAGKTLTIALVGLKPIGVSEETSRNLAQVLGSALKGVEGANVVSQEDIRSMLELEAQKQQLGCNDADCFAEIGGALGVDKMVTGSVGKMGERYVISLRLIDSRTSKVDARLTESFVGAESQLLPAVRHSARTLLGAQTDSKGALAISSNESEAKIFLNDDERGALPSEALSDLGPGRYRLRVSKDGYFDWQSDVYVEPMAATPVWAELIEKPPEWYETWWFWTAAGVIAVGAGTFYVINATALPDTDLGNVSLR